MKNHKFLRIVLFPLLFFLSSTIVILADTLSVSKIDTLAYAESLVTKFEDLFTASVLELFSSGQKIDSSEMNDFIIKDFTDYLKIFKPLEILSYGPVSQAKIVRFLGIPSERVGVFYDDNSYAVQSLYIPQSGDVELQIAPFENIESIQLLENGLINLRLWMP